MEHFVSLAYHDRELRDGLRAELTRGRDRPGVRRVRLNVVAASLIHELEVELWHRLLGLDEPRAPRAVACWWSVPRRLSLRPAAAALGTALVRAGQRLQAYGRVPAPGW